MTAHGPYYGDWGPGYDGPPPPSGYPPPRAQAGAAAGLRVMELDAGQSKYDWIPC